MKSMDDLNETIALITKAERKARILRACVYLFLIAALTLNMYCFLAYDSKLNCIAGVLTFLYMFFELVMNDIRALREKK